MSPLPGFLACSLILMLTSSTSALDKLSNIELMWKKPNEDIMLKCDSDACGGTDKERVMALEMYMRPAGDEQKKHLATMKANNKTDGTIYYDLEIINSLNNALNITASEEKKSVAIHIATRDLQSGDEYHCLVQYWNFTRCTNLCITLIKVIDVPIQSTTGSSWSEQTTPAESATGGTCACAKNQPKSTSAAERECLKWDVVSLVSFVVLFLLLVVLMVFVILTYRKFETRGLPQQTGKNVPEADALEIMVRNEPIYSVVKKW